MFGKCLHKYTIKEAIDDENVLGFSVEYYGTFNLKDENGDDLSPDEMKVEGIGTKEVFSKRERLEKIVDFIIANHRAKTFGKKYQSIFAVSDINTLIEYYHIFKGKNTDLKIAGIFTYEANSDLSNDEGTFEAEGDECKHPRECLDEMVSDYNKMFGDNFNLNQDNGFNSYFIDISKKVKERKIDVLLVVNMFLTGFDSKYLNTLYVDKNLKYHGLIQAYSRTNRILSVDKTHGNIVCFRNLKKRTDEAITLFSNANAVETVLMKNYEEYVADFEKYLQELRNTAETAEDIDNLETEENKLTFIENFKNLLRVMNRLTTFSKFTFDDLDISQDEFESFKSKYIDMYDTLVGQSAKNKGEKTSIIDEIDFEIELLAKDTINVSYIIGLLKNLNSEEKSFVKDIEYILKTMESTPSLKNKKDLVEQFIEENREIFNNNVSENIEDKLAEYLEKQKQKAILEMVEEENLKQDVVNQVIEECEFNNSRSNYSLVKTAFNKKPSLTEKLKIFKEKYPI